MNRDSVNFTAEVLGKRLGVARSGLRGRIAAGAEAIAAWARDHDVRIRTHDGSGLSSENRATPAAIARLLEIGEALPWGGTLRKSLPTGGQGTLARRLRGVPVRAKTGTLDRISALSGWVRGAGTGSWVEFSILSGRMSTSRAKAIEDQIVKTLHRHAG
jgi:D-alanyl-D-alanine carboxypeptidase/D-alanyl-D-alanine-endopeptidase (penicillin-binding protein 4)